MAYQSVSRAELRTHTSPRPGVRCVHDVVCWVLHGRGVRSGGIYNRRPIRGGIVPSLHGVGRAADFMVPVGDPVGGELMMRFVNSAQALGVGEVIFDRKRWTAEKGLKPYGGTNAHRDHVHVGFTVDFADRPYTDDLRRWVTHFLFGAP